MTTNAVRPRASARPEHDFNAIAAKKQAAAEALAQAEAEEAAARAARPSRRVRDTDDVQLLKQWRSRVVAIERDPTHSIHGALIAEVTQDDLLELAVAANDRAVGVRLLDLARRCHAVVESVGTEQPDGDVDRMFG